jgi:hypothetical protein
MRIPRRILNRQLWKKLVSLALVGAMLPGCAGSTKKITYLGDAPLTDYQDHVMEIDHPTVDEPTSDMVAATRKPRRLGDRSQDEIWDLSLAEAIHLALMNNKILRVRGDYRTLGSQVMANATLVPSTFDPAIQDSGVLFGGRGVEGALAQFDPVFNTQMVWGSNSAIQNNLLLSGGLTRGSVLDNDTGAFSTSITTCLLAARHPVVGIDKDPASRRKVRRNALALLREMRREKLLTKDPAGLIENLTVAGDFTALRASALVIECIFEDLAAKREVLRQVEDAVAPEALIDLARTEVKTRYGVELKTEVVVIGNR